MLEKAETIFHAALALPESQRDAYLREVCGADPGLRAEVETLLRAEAEAGSFLQPAPTGSGPQPSQMIGRYKLLQRIGEGGFGEVWMAEQKEPVRRRVALKIVKVGMDTRRLIARFEAERQALARMDHPGIARVFDAGATAEGRPYFVMELVRGVAITEYCDGESLSIEERLSLFGEVCLAVQHAHQKGIIHRDLKPSNVLVTVADGRPSPKVIDFGIAKATQGSLTDKTLFTEFQQVMGTPAYMSPEQADMSGLDMDTRSDVYSLGVLLYELLTGTTPFSAQELLAGGFAEIRRIIRETEPTKPSTKLSTSKTLASIAAHRRTAPGRLGALVRGDLDWIVMRCLEKERTRRYETASALAEDVRRHLAGEAVLAAPPSRSYRARKFVRRNRVAVTTGLLVGLALLLGIAGTTWGLLRAIDERDRADDNATLFRAASQAEAAARGEADAQATKAREEARRAERELARANEVKRFISGMLESVDPSTAQGRDTSILREILDDAAARIAAGEITDERIEAELRATIGKTYLALGEHELAVPFLRRALEIRRRVLGDEDPDTLISLHVMNYVLQEQGKLEEAQPFLRKALAGLRRVLGDDDLNTLTSICSQGRLLQAQGKLSEAEPFYREALERCRRVLGDDHPQTVYSINCMGFLQQARGKLSEAERLFREALVSERRSKGNEHPDTLTTIGNLAAALQAQGRLSEAEALHLEALEGCRRVLGDDHPETLNAIDHMGLLRLAQGVFSKAEPFLREALEGHRRVQGDDHPSTLLAIGNLGSLLQTQGNLSAAEPLLRESLERRKRVLGADHPHTLQAVNNIGGLLATQGNLSDSVPFLRAALEGRRRVLGANHPDTLGSINNMGGVLQALGRLSEAEPFLSEAVAGHRSVLGADHPATLNSMNNLGGLLQAQGKLQEAEQLFREALSGQRRALGSDHAETLTTTANLAALLLDLERHAEAGALLTQSEPVARRAWTGVNPRRLGDYLIKLARAQLGNGDRDAAEATLLEARPLLVEALGEGHVDALACARLLARIRATEAPVPSGAATRGE